MIRYNRRLELELLGKQRQEKIRLPKIQRSEGKTRMNMFKKSLRLSMQAVENEKERIKNVSAFVSAILEQISSMLHHKLDLLGIRHFKAGFINRSSFYLLLEFCYISNPYKCGALCGFLHRAHSIVTDRNGEWPKLDEKSHEREATCLNC